MKTFTKIKNVSDVRRMPRIDKIRLGVKFQKENTKIEFPGELPFFKLPEKAAEIHGWKQEPQKLVDRAKELGCTRKDVLDFILKNAHLMAESIPVMIPVEDDNVSFPQAYKMYGSSFGLKCIGDGESAQEKDEKTGQWIDKACPCPHLVSEENKKCKACGTERENTRAGKCKKCGAELPELSCTRKAHLQVILPDVSMGGVFQIDVGSFNSIVSINSSIEYVRALVGRVAMVPLTLKRIPIETHHDNKKQVHFICQLIFDHNILAVQELRKDNAKILSHQAALMLEPPEYMSDDEKPVDAVVHVSKEMQAMIDHLSKLGKDGKLFKSEVMAIKTSIDENDEVALATIADGIEARLKKGTSAADLTKALSEDKKPEPSATYPDGTPHHPTETATTGQQKKVF